MEVWVDLNDIETMHAAMVGARRHFNAATRDYKDAVGENGDFDTSLARHVNGAGGECAVAKLSGKYWGGHIDTFKGPDLGERVQVRTRPRHDWELLVRDRDNSEHAFILVTGIMPRFAVRGWIMGRDAKQQRWLKAHGGLDPAYFVPQDALLPLFKQEHGA